MPGRNCNGRRLTGPTRLRSVFPGRDRMQCSRAKGLLQTAFCSNNRHPCLPIKRRTVQHSPRHVQIFAIRTPETKDTRSIAEEPKEGLQEMADDLSQDRVKREEQVRRSVRTAWRRILLELSSLPRSMVVLGVISFLSAVGTVIEQGREFQFYLDNYPDGESKVLGFVTYKLIFFLQLDHIYTAPYFYGLITLLVAQLIACTKTRQWPIARVARKWKFVATINGIAMKENAEVLPDANIRDLGAVLNKKGYEIFLKDGRLYGFKCLVGRLAPIGVHAAMLVTIAGICWGVLGGFKGSAMIPEGQSISVERFMRPNSFLSSVPSGGKKTLRVDGFEIDYRSNGSIGQFYSDLSVLDSNGVETKRKRISVNDPLRFEGITMYQTDWGMSALTVTAESKAFSEGKRTVRLPMASFDDRENGGARRFATFIPLPDAESSSDTPAGISVLANDFQTVALYDAEGKFSGIRRPGSGKSIDVSGLRLTIEDITGSTGLEIKYDPGVPLVYAGFAALMITTILSYLSHAQIWAIQNGGDIHVAGTSNRAGILFKKEYTEILDLVPDRGLNQ